MYALMQDIRVGIGLLYRSAKSSASVALIVVLSLVIDAGSIARLGRQVKCYSACHKSHKLLKGATEMYRFYFQVLTERIDILPSIKLPGVGQPKA